MKSKLTYILFLLLAVPAAAQTLPIDEETKKVIYSATVEVDSLEKEVLFDRAKKWLISTTSSKLEAADAEKGELKNDATFIIKLTYDFKYKKDVNITYGITINQKEGKYRYIFDNFRVYEVKSGPRSEESLEAYYNKQRYNSKPEIASQIDAEIQKTIADLKKAIEEGEFVEKDDW